MPPQPTGVCRGDLIFHSGMNHHPRVFVPMHTCHSQCCRIFAEYSDYEEGSHRKVMIIAMIMVIFQAIGYRKNYTELIGID